MLGWLLVWKSGSPLVGKNVIVIYTLLAVCIGFAFPLVLTNHSSLFMSTALCLSPVDAIFSGPASCYSLEL